MFKGALALSKHRAGQTRVLSPTLKSLRGGAAAIIAVCCVGCCILAESDRSFCWSASVRPCLTRKERKLPRWYTEFLRQGMTKAVRRDLERLWPLYGRETPWGKTYDLQGAEIWGDRFGRPVVLDIGFGAGDTLVAAALENPECNVLGIEWYKTGIRDAMLKVEQFGLSNVRILRGDATQILRARQIVGRGIVRTGVFFPDPWLSEKDVHHRLISKEFLRNLGELTAVDGTLCIATNRPVYADHCAATVHDLENWTAAGANPDGHVQRPPWRPVTQFEARFLQEGYQVFDMQFRFTR